ncbi:MAG: hypothetical protein FOGNACKC_01966 [Anaerolineae bacterium]|nr:hypothetical protein [Anaerolineae bacterium]
MLQQDTKQTLFDATVLKTAILYCRVSTDEQAETGTSIDNQVQVGLAYAKEAGLFVPAEFVFKEDFSGKTLERPELIKVRKLLQTGQAQALIVYKADRLDRSEWGANLIHLLGELKSLDAELHYSEDRVKVDLKNPFEVFMHGHFKGFFAGEDHRATVVKLLKGRRNKVKDYGSVMVSSRPPFGYDVIKMPVPENPKMQRQELIINESEADAVRKIYQWYLFGDEDGVPLGFVAITQKLMALGIPTKGDKNRKMGKKHIGKWYPCVIGGILKNETYAGVWKYGKDHPDNCVLEKEVLEVTVPAIIPRDMWQLAQERRKIKLHSTSRKYEYLLLGRVICGHCGMKMTGENKQAGKYRYYFCPAAKGTSFRRCESHTRYRVDKVDAVVWEWLTRIFTDETGQELRDGLAGYRAKKTGEGESIEHDIKIADKSIKEIEGRLESLYQDHRAASSEYLKKRIESDMQLLEAQLKSQQLKATEYRQKLAEHTVTPQDEIKLLEFAAHLRPRWAAISEDIESKKAVLSRFNITVKLQIIDGKRYAIVTGKIVPDEEVLPIKNGTT